MHEGYGRKECFWGWDSQITGLVMKKAKKKTGEKGKPVQVQRRTPWKRMDRRTSDVWSAEKGLIS